MTKREIRKMAAVVRDELARMNAALRDNDLEWVKTHAQQAAGLACTMEEFVFQWAQEQTCQ